jgi:RNA polymerase subunit RPABC4/transcription elongation factor Spt4
MRLKIVRRKIINKGGIMEKHELRKAIQTELAVLGIFMMIDQGSDLSLDIKFKDTTNKNKFVHYKNKVLLDENRQEVYYWEKVQDESSGLFSDNDIDTTTQVGSVLFRKVYHTYTDSSGREIETKLDIGTINKTIKECAKEFGWKFKVVLSQRKASFSDEENISKEYIEPPLQPSTSSPSSEACVKCGSAINHSDKFCPHCGNPRVSNQASDTIIQPIKASKLKAPKPKFGIFKILAIAVLVPILGFVGLVVWELIAGDSTPEMPSGVVTEASSNYVDMGYTIYVVPFHESIDSNKPQLYDLKLWVLVYQDYLTVNQTDDPIDSISITDFYLNALNKGKLERFEDSIYIHSASGAYYEGTTNTDGITIPLTGVISDNAGYMDTISFSFHISEISEYEYPSDYSGEYFEDIAFENAGITSDDIRFGFSYMIRLKTVSGKEYIRSIEIDPLEGELIYIELDNYVTSDIESDILDENLFQEVK